MFRFFFQPACASPEVIHRHVEPEPGFIELRLCAGLPIERFESHELFPAVF
jgi:hypothetical protein